MAEIVWTEEAERWQRDIHDYIASNNSVTAAKVIAGIFEKPQALLHFPKTGHKCCDEPEGEIRTLLYGHYRIAYLLRPSGNRSVGRVSWCIGYRKIFAVIKRFLSAFPGFFFHASNLKLPFPGNSLFQLSSFRCR